MNTVDQFKDEAARLFWNNPLNACEMLARKVNGHKWHFTTFDCDIRLFDGIAWTVKSRFTSIKTKENHKKVWEELEALFKDLGLKAQCYKVADHRSYSTHQGKRVFTGHQWEYFIEFEPDFPMNVSVLTD